MSNLVKLRFKTKDSLSFPISDRKAFLADVDIHAQVLKTHLNIKNREKFFHYILKYHKYDYIF